MAVLNRLASMRGNTHDPERDTRRFEHDIGFQVSGVLIEGLDIHFERIVLVSDQIVKVGLFFQV